MTVITAPLGPVGLLAVAYMGILFANFSRRLSTVTKMKNYYRWFVMATILVVVAAASQVMRSTASLAPEKAPRILLEPWFSLISFHIPLAIGVSITMWLVWYYWGWILREEVK